VDARAGRGRRPLDSRCAARRKRRLGVGDRRPSSSRFTLTPELPDVDVYVAALLDRVAGTTLEGVRLNSPFLLRTVTPPLAAVEGRRVVSVRRLGKRVVIALEEELFLAIHLMIAGRLHWKPKGTKLAG